jgi:hypothetical protein
MTTAILAREANQIIRQLELWLETRESKSIRLQFKPIDQARLLRLRTWEYRYKLSIGEILDYILIILRKQMPKGKTFYGLGVPVPTLTGSAARRILEDQIEENFPDGTLETIWRERERQDQLKREQEEELAGLGTQPTKLLLDFESSQEFVQDYVIRTEREKMEYERSRREKWRQRKSYRDNPW